jgi:hypothetical protein
VTTAGLFDACPCDSFRPACRHSFHIQPATASILFVIANSILAGAQTAGESGVFADLIQVAL